MPPTHSTPTATAHAICSRAARFTRSVAAFTRRTWALADTDGRTAERQTEARHALKLRQLTAGAMVGIVHEVHAAVPIDVPCAGALQAPSKADAHRVLAHPKEQRASISERCVVRKGWHAEIALAL